MAMGTRATGGLGRSAGLLLSVLALGAGASAWAQEAGAGGSGGVQTVDPWAPRPPTRVPVSRAAATVQQFPLNDRTPLPPRAPLPEIEDAEVADVMALLSGSFRADAAGTEPAVDMHLARVDIEGTDAAVYFEAARADAPHRPFRQGLYLVARIDGQLRLRVMEFNGRPEFPDSIVGLWMFPERFPAMGLRFLKPVMDLNLSREGSGWTARSTHRTPARTSGPVAALNAWEAEAELRLGGGQVVVIDRLFDQKGGAIKGYAGEARTFKAFTPASKATMVDGCLLILDLVPGTGTLAIGPDTHAAVTYRAWTTDGRLFADYQRENNGEPIQIQWPAPFITGFGDGIKGMTVGGIRRMVIPPGLGFGDAGDIRWEIPGGAFLTFEIQPVWIETHENMMKAGLAGPREGVLPASRKDPGR
jgi:FKBP-type peptidyl-prolyl cis-trans isomerase FkpA